MAPVPFPACKNLLSMPPEIIPMISSYLDYPDILSLRLVHPHFYYSPLLNTDNDAGIRSRVAWLCSVGSFGPLEVLLRPKPTLKLPFSLLLNKDISIWALVDPLRFSWRTEDISRVCLRLKTDSEFLSNVQVQRMLRLRINHAACAGGNGCRVVPGTVCSGPKEKCGLGSCVLGFRHAMHVLFKDLASRTLDWRHKSVLSGWDLLFLIMISVTLVMPWSLLIQEMSRFLGREIGLHTAGILVIGMGTMLVMSLIGQSRAYVVSTT